MQNLCHDTEWSARALGHGVDRQLTALLGHEDSNVVKYAAGALKNISSTTQTELASEQKGAIELRAREVALQAFSEAAHTAELANSPLIFRRTCG